MSDWVPTTCMRCAVGCGHLQRGADVGNGIDVVRGDAAHPVNQGLACQRGVRESADPDGEWLTRPQVRRDGELVSTTWDVALAEAITGLRAADDEGEVAVVGSGQQTNEAAYALGKLARGGFGTRYYDANTTLCMASAVTAYYQAFGSDAPPCTYDDIPEAERHVVWGANPAVAHPVMFRWIRRTANADGVDLLVVDPVATETADHADVHVAPDPGQDLTLARAVLARLVETDRVDEDFVAAATEGFDELRESLPDSAAAAAADAGVSPGAVDRLADAFDRRALCYWGMGVNQHVQGTDTARALIDLCLATGNLRPGSGPFSLTGQANSMGTRICSSKGSWPGQRDFRDLDERATVAEAWDIPVERLPPDPGPGPVDLFDAIGDDIEAVWTVATNPVAGMPDASTARERLDDAFLVAQDAFRTETTELADVVLPAATWGESEGTATNMERTVSRVRAATDAPSGVWSDLRIVATVGRRLFPALFDEADPDPETVFDEFRALTAGTAADVSGITYDRLAEETAVRWPAPDAETNAGYRYYQSDDVADRGDGGDDSGDAGDDSGVAGDISGDATDDSGDGADTDGSDGNDGDTDDVTGESWSFPTASGLARFSTGRQGDLPEPVDDEYPLTLTTAREADGYNTGVRSRSVADPEPLVARIHPSTVAASDAVTDGRVRLETRRDAVPTTVDPDPAVPEGLVWLPIHHPLTNRLTIDAVDPQSDEPNLKQCAVRMVAPVGTVAAGEDLPASADD